MRTLALIAASVLALSAAACSDQHAQQIKEGASAAGQDIKDAANEAWLFVQFKAPANLEGSRLRITLLRDQFADQLTSVQLRDGDRRLTLLFPPGETERRITWLR